jgi:hypothetical protein
MEAGAQGGVRDVRDREHHREEVTVIHKMTPTARRGQAGHGGARHGSAWQGKAGKHNGPGRTTSVPAQPTRLGAA